MELRSRSRPARRRPGFCSRNRAGFRGSPHRGAPAHRKFLSARREAGPVGSFAGTGAIGSAAREKDLDSEGQSSANRECTIETNGATPSPLNEERVGVRGENSQDAHRLTRLFQLAHSSPLIPLSLRGEGSSPASESKI